MYHLPSSSGSQGGLTQPDCVNHIPIDWDLTGLNGQSPVPGYCLEQKESTVDIDLNDVVVAVVVVIFAVVAVLLMLFWAEHGFFDYPLFGSGKPNIYKMVKLYSCV